MSRKWLNKEYCQYTILEKDVPRYTGGPNRYQMHYKKRQCKRRATHGGYCWQHRHSGDVRLWGQKGGE